MDFHYCALLWARDICACSWRGWSWWILRWFTHNANYTLTYFNLVPAFIRRRDKLGNYHNRIAPRPWSYTVTECLASLLVIYPFLCTVYFIHGLLIWTIHLPTLWQQCVEWWFSLPSTFIFLPFCLTRCLAGHSVPCMNSIKTLFLPFSSYAAMAAPCVWGASERSSLCTS